MSVKKNTTGRFDVVNRPLLLHNMHQFIFLRRERYTGSIISLYPSGVERLNCNLEHFTTICREGTVVTFDIKILLFFKVV